ncbi:transmembrane protein 91, partial [Chelydra serpentina]
VTWEPRTPPDPQPEQGISASWRTSRNFSTAAGQALRAPGWGRAAGTPRLLRRGPAGGATAPAGPAAAGRRDPAEDTGAAGSPDPAPSRARGQPGAPRWRSRVTARRLSGSRLSAPSSARRRTFTQSAARWGTESSCLSSSTTRRVTARARATSP